MIPGSGGKAFRSLDLDDSGSISIDEIKKMLPAGLKEAEVDKLLNEIDIDGDGEIDIDEFNVLFA